MESRKLIVRVFFAFALIMLGKLCYLQGLPHQLEHPVLVNPMADNMYWVFYILNIPQFLLNNTIISIAFESTLIFSAMLSILFPKNVLYPRTFCCLFICLFITCNTFHGHGWVAILISSLLFCFKKDKNFILCFYALRYYVIFVFFSAAMWKLSRGGLFLENQMSEILKVQHLSQLVGKPNNIYPMFIQLMIGSPILSQAFLVFAFLVQFAFAIGFFTKRYDQLLLSLFFLFFLGDWVFMGISFFEFYIFCLPLIRWPEIQKKYAMLD